MLNKRYSSFGQLKGLLWKDYYDAILDKDFKPPVGAVIDLTDSCNFNCYWCNAQSFRSGNMLETEHVKECIDMLSDWGCKSICYAGGGEPSLHKDFDKIIKYTYEQDVEVGISTNGLLLDDTTIENINKYSEFCGISIDAGKKETWSNLKGVKESKWSKLIDNIKKFDDTNLDFTYKFMIVPENQDEIFEAGKKAKGLGFSNFFVRPAAFEKVRGLEQTDMDFNVDRIKQSYDKLMSLEDDNFTIYKSFGRVDEEFHKEREFDTCRATPIIAVLCADSYCYLCIDRREDEESRMCKHLELRDYWNSEEHHKMIENIDLDRCPRCAFSHYNQQLEAYKEDYMFWKFP